MQRIGPADLVTVDEVNLRRHLFPKRFQLRWVVLRVAVGVEDQLFCRRTDAGLQRAAIAAIFRMVNDPYVAIRASKFVGDFGCRVGAAVVDDDDFVIGGQLRRRRHGTDHHTRDGAAVVIGGKEDAQTRWFLWWRQDSLSIRDFYESRPISFQGVIADSIITARESFDSPRRRSTNVMGTSTTRRPRRVATYSISTRNE